MCGIVGYINLSGAQLDPSASHLPAMCRSIHHRGPDDSGELVVGPCALGMTRLSIIDLSSGHQPISNEDGSIWIVFNGEIYNYKGLQKLVLEKGHKLATASDTEVIVHLYEEYGVDCLAHLEGMFAFALWDKNKQRLFIARDRMGEKPLHYGVFDGQLIFASELKGLLAHPSCPRRLNVEALQQYLFNEYVAAPRSIFDGIHKLLPAHYLLVEGGELATRQYWQLQGAAPIQQSEEEAANRLVELLQESIKGRLISDVPLGIFLSGGLDSSTIAALALRATSDKVKTFAIGFADASFDESAHAQAVADYLGTDHTTAIFSAGQAAETLCQLWDYLDEPIADASCLPTFFLASMTRKRVTVALAGEGGDELFGGYPTYQAHQLVDKWRLVPEFLRRGLIEPAVKALPVSLDNLSFDYKAKRFIEAAAEVPVMRHLRWMGAMPLSDQVPLLKPHMLEFTASTDLMPEAAAAFLKTAQKGAQADLVSQIMKLDLATYLPDDLLVKSDRASMAASLEVRLPFLAWPLVEYALSLPSSYKVRGATTKYLLRRAAARLLPPAILKRPKKGFGIPVGKWLGKELKPFADELLGEDFVKRQNVFEWPYIQRLRAEHDQGRFDRRKQLWTLFMFQWWWKKFMRD